MLVLTEHLLKEGRRKGGRDPVVSLERRGQGGRGGRHEEQKEALKGGRGKGPFRLGPCGLGLVWSPALSGLREEAEIGLSCGAAHMARALHTIKGLELYAVGNGGSWVGCESLPTAFPLPSPLPCFPSFCRPETKSLRAREHALGLKEVAGDLEGTLFEGPLFLALSPDIQTRARVVERGRDAPQSPHIHPERFWGAPRTPRALCPKGAGKKEEMGQGETPQGE